MSERMPNTPETLLPPNEAIANTLEEWLGGELVNSRGADYQNFYLSAFDEFGGNQLAKNDSHTDRLRVWTNELFAKHPEDEEVIARQLYGVLTGLSGAVRANGYVQASDQTTFECAVEYVYSRVDFRGKVENRLLYQFGHLPSQNDLRTRVVTAESLAQETLSVNEMRHAIHKEIPVYSPFVVPETDIRNEEDLKTLQGAWIDLAVDYILYTANLHDGDITRVKLPKPLPINQTELYAPFEKQRTLA